jgi:hypothetical protein
MFKHVAVEHPVAGIVGNKRDLGPLAAQQQNRVLPGTVRFCPAVA